MFVAVVVVVGGFFLFNSYIYNEKQAYTPGNYKDAEYRMDGKVITLKEEFRYFGNELVTDLNGDGRDDVVFLLTHQPGGSGSFFYVVAAISTEEGYLGSEGFFLGDRIAPQTTEVSQNPAHANVIVVNYADRGPGEPMTTQSSFGKSIYLKLDVESMRWKVIEGESR